MTDPKHRRPTAPLTALLRGGYLRPPDPDPNFDPYAMKGPIDDTPFEKKWTAHDHALEAVRTLLEYVGEDPDREGLLETPARFLRALAHYTSGYKLTAEQVLKTFVDGSEGGSGEMVIVHNIPFRSMCEHHLAPVNGVAHVGYIPSGSIVGLSKLARLVDVFGRRLQVQERATQQIANALVEHLKPEGVGVLIRASHGCMSHRGVQIHNSVTTTSAMRGALLEDAAARSEFLALCRDGERYYHG